MPAMSSQIGYDTLNSNVYVWSKGMSTPWSLPQVHDIKNILSWIDRREKEPIKVLESSSNSEYHPSSNIPLWITIEHPDK